jgi:hypothetical protein
MLMAAFAVQVFDARISDVKEGLGFSTKSGERHLVAQHRPVMTRARQAAEPEFHKEAVAPLKDLAGRRGVMQLGTCDRAVEGLDW